jgi:hypothetical protein
MTEYDDSLFEVGSYWVQPSYKKQNKYVYRIIGNLNNSVDNVELVQNTDVSNNYRSRDSFDYSKKQTFKDLVLFLTPRQAQLIYIKKQILLLSELWGINEVKELLVGLEI